MKDKSFIVAFIFVGITEIFKGVAQFTNFYTERIYPMLFRLLHSISSLFPFSIYDILVTAAILTLFSGLIFIWFKRYRLRYLKGILLSVIWLYVWFYFSWGINYFGSDFYQKNNIPRAQYDSLIYDKFVQEFCDSLNSTYSNDNLYLGEDLLRKDIKIQYTNICSSYNLPPIPQSYRTKNMLYSRIYAAVGVTGYYGPLLAEIHCNGLLLPEERPFTLAHETAHLLGVTSEAEANLYAYLVTIRSNDKATRFSGYFEIMPFVLSNYRKCVNDSTYRQVYRKINPDIFKLYAKQREHWQELRVEKANKVQNAAHNTYLKMNKIPQGITNYSEVVELILSVYSLSQNRNTNL